MTLLSKISQILKKRPDPTLILVKGNDPRLINARKQALQELPYFLSVIKSDEWKNKYDYSVKSMLTSDGQREHFWVEVTHHKDGYFHGKLGNEPHVLKNIKIHAPVRVKDEFIEDWLLHDKSSDKFEGGFSIKALGGKLNFK